jgi:hypothetical protein
MWILDNMKEETKEEGKGTFFGDLLLKNVFFSWFIEKCRKSQDA